MMNKKQLIVLVAGILALILIAWFTPRYKVTAIGGDNYIITEQTSSLYERSRGAVRLHWDKILLYEGLAIPICGLLMWAFRRKNG
ncbi:hypothetical protein BU251_03665 [Candidatus Velamenicoccus archaeovorus]|uniref:Uncharacterized protein n=1 Tax=Velamenicoccus archaeovorus TaxID=1930593 RepID=A0A410P453_VELA1|nr:hypothetical protein [Candidatus Velamenicoccus archaeovorus]QAT16892.1 hypothetical protein BU251_03665 [Candidatus Velamenicoccus archaeovorus]